MMLPSVVIQVNTELWSNSLGLNFKNLELSTAWQQLETLQKNKRFFGWLLVLNISIFLKLGIKYFFKTLFNKTYPSAIINQIAL